MACLAWSGEGTHLGSGTPVPKGSSGVTCCSALCALPCLWMGPLQVICSCVRGRPRPRPRGESLGDTSPNIADCTPASPPLLIGSSENAPQTDPSAASSRAQDPGCAACRHPSTSGSGTQRLGPRGSHRRLRGGPLARPHSRCPAQPTPASNRAPFCCSFSPRGPSGPSPPPGFCVQPGVCGRGCQLPCLGWVCSPSAPGSWSQAKPRLCRVI